MAKVLFIEDDFLWQVKLEQMMQGQDKFKILGFASSTREALLMIDAVKPDIIVADLILGQQNILDTFDSYFGGFPTLFISSTESAKNFEFIQQHKMSCFLVKPFHSFSLISCLGLLSDNYVKKTEKFINIGSSSKSVKKLFLKNIKFIIAEGNYCIIYTTDGKKYAKKISLRRILDEIQTDFLQVNKSTIVNKSFIEKMDYNFDKVYVARTEHSVGRIYKNSLQSAFE